MIDLEDWAKESDQESLANKEQSNMASVIYDGDTVDLQEAVNALSTKLKTLQTTLDETIANKLLDFEKTNANNSPMNLTLNNDSNTRPYFDLVSSIPSLDGGRADLVVPFFDNIDSIGEISNWSEAQKVQVIKLKLVGAALQFFKTDELCKSANSSLEIRNSFTKRFGDSLPDHYYFEELASIRQLKNESIEQFSDRVKRISDKTVRTNANEEVNKILREEADRRAMEAFVRGLYGEVGRQTRVKFPQNFREAVGTAVALNNLEKRPNSDIERPRRVFRIEPQPIICFNCKKTGHKAAQCWANTTPQRGRGQQPYRSHYQSQRGRGNFQQQWHSPRGRGNFQRQQYFGHDFGNQGKRGQIEQLEQSNQNSSRGRGFHSGQGRGENLNTSGVPTSAAGSPARN